MTTLEQIYSRHAEEAILGAVLIDPECYKTVPITSAEFYVERNRWIWDAIGEIVRRGEVADYVTLGAELDKSGKLGAIGGDGYILGLINQCPSALNVNGYAAVVREKAKRRRVIQIANELASGAYDLDGDITTVISLAMDSLSRSIVSSRGARPISEFLELVYDEVDKASLNPSSLIGVPTGLTDWDAFGGIPYGEVLKLAGDPGVGKSLLAFQILIHAAKQGYKCALYEMEMSGKQVVRRGISAESNITTQAMRTGKLKEEEWPLLTHAFEVMAALPIYITDSDMTTADFRADTQRLKDAYGLDIVVIDYEALFQDGSNIGEIERQNLISANVKSVAKSTGAAVISIGDMTKEGIQRKTTGQGAMAGTGRVLHNADQTVMLLKDDAIADKYNLVWTKNREGSPNQFVPLLKRGTIPVFIDYALPSQIANAPITNMLSKSAQRPGGAR